MQTSAEREQVVEIINRLFLYPSLALGELGEDVFDGKVRMDMTSLVGTDTTDSIARKI
jgi:hypothetical protein